MDNRWSRQIWHRLEHLHGVTYYAAECRAASSTVGLRGFWMGYFASRAAPFGPVGPGLVEATFFNFAPAMVRRSLPDAWRFASPAAVLVARRGAAGAALRRLVPDIEETAFALLPVVRACIAAAPGGGRPLFSANRDLGLPADPVEALWQAATTLREHRGDGHVAILTARGLDGPRAHILLTAERAQPAEILRDNRGWTLGQWEQATAILVRQGLLSPDGRLTPTGAKVRAAVEADTDELACSAFADLPADQASELFERLNDAATVVARSATIPYPNPIGLPPLR